MITTKEKIKSNTNQISFLLYKLWINENKLSKDLFLIYIKNIEELDKTKDLLLNFYTKKLNKIKTEEIKLSLWSDFVKISTNLYHKYEKIIKKEFWELLKKDKYNKIWYFSERAFLWIISNSNHFSFLKLYFPERNVDKGDIDKLLRFKKIKDWTKK